MDTKTEAKLPLAVLPTKPNSTTSVTSKSPATPAQSISIPYVPPPLPLSGEEAVVADLVYCLIAQRRIPEADVESLTKIDPSSMPEPLNHLVEYAQRAIQFTAEPSLEVLQLLLSSLLESQIWSDRRKESRVGAWAKGGGQWSNK